MSHKSSAFVLRPRRVCLFLTAVVCVLVVFSVLAQYAKLVLGHGRLLGFVPQFSLDAESNVPTYFSSLILLAASLLAGVIARGVRDRDAPFSWHWRGLALLFASLSLDEAVSLHEGLIDPVRQTLNVGGAFYQAWVIPGLVLVFAFVVAYLRFFWHLPARWKKLFALAGGLYVGGALGMEMVGGWYWTTYGEWGFGPSLLATTEEALEMGGVVVFIFALLEYLRVHGPTVRIAFGPKEGRNEEDAINGAVGRSAGRPAPAQRDPTPPPR